MVSTLQASILVALIGSGLVAGIFFAFSTFIMRALIQVPSAQGIAAMQTINVTVLNPWFFTAFFGTGLACLPIAWMAWGSPSGRHQALLLTACALYLLGCILVTIAGNVPLNDRLAAVAADSVEAHNLWSHYLSRWTLWNHVRTAASLAAAALFAVSLWAGPIGD